MGYQRPYNPKALKKPEKIALLKEYAEHYKNIARAEPDALNRKLSRKAFEPLLDRIGQILLEESDTAAERGPVREFLNANPLPPTMAKLLPDNFRAYCLALNALKQWIAAEQSATDRYLLGGTARKACREVFDCCLVTGEDLGDKAELHHPVRDGRPPVLLSKKGHASIEKQTSMAGDDPLECALIELRRETNQSWAQLRRGCRDLVGRPLPASSAAMAASARSLARKAMKRTGVPAEDILIWLDNRKP